MTRVAFNGLGLMGGGMAARLVGAGFDVTVWNRSPERARRLRDAGAKVASTPAEASRDAEVVIIMVADDRASREVWTRVLETVPRGAILIDSSTITPSWVRELDQAARDSGCSLLDAPVTGSRPQAENGELLFLVGGDADVLEKARPVLQPMSRGVVHLGPVGSGATMKLINNFLCGVQVAGLAEAVSWIERSGLDRSAAVSILANGAPGSPLVKGLSERMVHRSYDPNFRLELMAKDLTYAGAEARLAGIELSTGDAALRHFEDATRKGHGDKDLSAVVEALRH